MASKVCRTRLISDIPASEDEFGSHQRLADAVANLILSEDDGGKTIGLEGDWGAGKSTVVNLIQNKIQESSDNLFFLFDAWAHHQDPLRRTFLEELLSEGEQGWIPEEDKGIWKKRRKVLAKQVKYEHKITHSNLKLWAKWFIVSTLFMPLGIALLTSGIGIESVVSTIIGFVIALFPAGILIWVQVKHNQDTKTQKQEDEKSDPWTFLVKNSETDYRTETFQSPNPTSVEFSETFSDYMEAVSQNNIRKIVIVVDNLDRIETDEALSLLSILQTFLQSGAKKAQWLEKLWVIIPYDRKGLEKLWQSRNGGNDGKESSAQSHVATSFLDKRFQIRFTIPPIVLSDWSAYLKRLLKEAFPDHDENEFHSAYRVYAKYRQKPNSAPTPRELKLYVNQIGATHRQWRDTFPLAHVGYYVLLNRSGKQIIKGLLDGEYEKDEIKASLGENLNASLSALTFNVEVERAQQLLLKTPIKKALEFGDGTEILDLHKLSGFQQVLESISFADLAAEPEKLANTFSALDKSGILFEIETDSRNIIIKRLQRTVNSVAMWYPFNPKIVDGMSSMFKLLDADSSLMTTTLTVVLNNKIEKYLEEPQFLHSWIDGFIQLLGIIKKNVGEQELLSLPIRIPCSSDVYIDVCNYLYNNNESRQFWHFIQSNSPEKEIESSFSSVLKENQLKKYHIQAVRVMQQQNLNFNWEGFLEIAENKLASTTNYAPEFIEAQLAFLWHLKDKTPEIQTILDKLTTRGSLLHHMSVAQENINAKAYCMFSFIQNNPSVQYTGMPGLASGGQALIERVFSSPEQHVDLSERIVELFGNYREYNLVFEISATQKTKKWVSQLFKIIALRKDSQLFFKSDIVLQHWKKISDALDNDTVNELLQKLIAKTDILKHITNNDFSIDYSELYTKLVQNGGVKNIEYKKWCVAGIQQIAQDNMQEHANKNDAVAELIVDLVEQKVKITLGQNYQEVLFDHGSALLDNQIGEGRLVNHWDNMFVALDRNSKSILRTRLMTAAIQRAGDIPDTFFAYYGDELIKTANLENMDKLVLNLFTPLVKNRNPVGIAWIAQLLEKKQSFLSRYSPKTQTKDLRRWVQEALRENTENELEENLQKIAVVLKNTLRRKPTSKKINQKNK